jgi:hypothetical protein
MKLSRKSIDATVVSVLIALAVSLLFLTAPKSLNFWWADAPAHGLNGALIHDFIAARAFAAPYQFAVDYYLRYPALTISLYPPLFPMVEAAVYAVFGFSHFAAQLTVALFSAVFALFLYKLVRIAAPTLTAGAVVLLAFSLPEIALWSRQVMLEIPAYSLLVGSAYYLLRHLREGKPHLLYLAVLFYAGAVYTKQTTAFAVAPFALTLVYARGVAVLRERAFWLAALLGVLLVAPLGLFTILWASHNVDIVTGIGPEQGQNLSWSALGFYVLALPEIAGILPVAAAVLYLIIVALAGWKSDAERLLGVVMILWFATDYVFIIVIAHREMRYGIFLLLPIVVMAVSLATRVLPERIAPVAALAVGALAFSMTLVRNDVPRIEGYEKVASFIVQQVGQKGLVLFHGYRSPNFVFAMRQLDQGAYIPVLRAEKLLVDYRVTREFGIKDRSVTAAEIEGIIDRYGITYVVLQPDFWTDLPSIAELQRYVYSDRFTKVATFPILGNVVHDDQKIEVFKNNRPTMPTNRGIELNMPMLKKKIEGGYK